MVSSGILSLRTDAQFPQKSRRERFFRRGGNCIQAINFRIGKGPLSKSLILSSHPLFSGRAIIKAGEDSGRGGGGEGISPSYCEHQSINQSTLFKHGKWLSKPVFRHAV